MIKKFGFEMMHLVSDQCFICLFYMFIYADALKKGDSSCFICDVLHVTDFYVKTCFFPLHALTSMNVLRSALPLQRDNIF